MWPIELSHRQWPSSSFKVFPPILSKNKCVLLFWSVISAGDLKDDNEWRWPWVSHLKVISVNGLIVRISNYSIFIIMYEVNYDFISILSYLTEGLLCDAERDLLAIGTFLVLSLETIQCIASNHSSQVAYMNSFTCSLGPRQSYAIVTVCLSVCLSFVRSVRLSLSRITHERVCGRWPNMVGMDKRWPSRSG